MTLRLTLVATVLLLAGCDNIVALMADPKVAQRIADSRAIGSACRYGMRSIEDCYTLNEKASKAAVFDGWKEMDQYMRDNKIDGVLSKADKAAQPIEEIIDDKAGANASKDKMTAGAKPKPPGKPAEKPADKATN